MRVCRPAVEVAMRGATLSVVLVGYDAVKGTPHGPVHFESL